MKCPMCGVDVEDRGVICGNCGESIRELSTEDDPFPDRFRAAGSIFLVYSLFVLCSVIAAWSSNPTQAERTGFVQIRVPILVGLCFSGVFLLKLKEAALHTGLGFALAELAFAAARATPTSHLHLLLAVLLAGGILLVLQANFEMLFSRLKQ